MQTIKQERLGMFLDIIDPVDQEDLMEKFKIFVFIKGIVKYTSNFVVPASTSPDILPDTPSGVSGGSKLAKITDGAVTFDGTGDFLGLAKDVTNFGSGDFTVGNVLHIFHRCNCRNFAWTVGKWQIEDLGCFRLMVDN